MVLWPRAHVIGASSSCSLGNTTTSQASGLCLVNHNHMNGRSKGAIGYTGKCPIVCKKQGIREHPDGQAEISFADEWKASPIAGLIDIRLQVHQAVDRSHAHTETFTRRSYTFNTHKSPLLHVRSCPLVTPTRDEQSAYFRTHDDLAEIPHDTSLFDRSGRPQGP